MLQDSRNSRSNSSRCWSRTKPFPDGSTIGNLGHYQQRHVSRQYPHPLMQRPPAESDDVLKLLEMEFFSDRRNRDLMFNVSLKLTDRLNIRVTWNFNIDDEIQNSKFREVTCLIYQITEK